MVRVFMHPAIVALEAKIVVAEKSASGFKGPERDPGHGRASTKRRAPERYGGACHRHERNAETLTRSCGRRAGAELLWGHCDW